VKRDELLIRVHSPSLKEKAFFFASGAIMSIPLTLFVDQLAGTLLVGLSAGIGYFIDVTVFAPLIEEFSKAIPLFYRHGETERSIFNLAVMVGLGFGLVEMLTYVGVYGVPIIIDRLPSLFFHPASASITAYGIATKKTWHFYLIAVALHFANNFLALTVPADVPISLSIIVVVITVLFSWRLHDKTKEIIIE
jgi:RsiW-degrading membrane proteinase PrsW (M82 family)